MSAAVIYEEWGGREQRKQNERNGKREKQKLLAQSIPCGTETTSNLQQLYCAE